MRAIQVVTCAVAVGVLGVLVAPPVQAQQAGAAEARGSGSRWPRVSFTAEGGVGGFGASAGDAARPGVTWGGRAAVEFLPWLAVEGRYMGMWNEGDDAVAGPDVALITHAGVGVVRLTMPIRVVQPYAFWGLGVYHTSLLGSDAALQTTTLKRTINGGTPLGVGLALPIDRRWTFGLGGAYHGLFGESFYRAPPVRPDGTVADGAGYLWTATGVVRLSL